MTIMTVHYYKNIVHKIVYFLVMFGCYGTSAVAQSDVDLATQGSIAFIQKDYRKAIILLNNALEKNPNLSLIVHRRLGQSYEAVDAYDSALVVYGNLKERASIEIYSRQIEILLDIKKNVKAARTIWTAMNKAFPKSIEPYIILNKILLKEGKKMMALDTLLYAQKVFPKDQLLFQECINHYLAENLDDEIVKFIDGVISNKKYSEIYSDIIVNTIDSLLTRGDIASSLNLMKKVDSLHIADASKSSLELKYYLKTTKDTANALLVGRNLLTLQPRNMKLLFEMANLEQLKGDKRKALEIHEYLLTNGYAFDQSKMIYLYLETAKEYHRIGNYGKEIETYKKIAQSTNLTKNEQINILEIYYNAAMDYHRERAYEKGIEILKAVPPLNYRTKDDKMIFAKIDYGLAKLYYRLDNYLSAKKYSESALRVYLQQQQIEPNNATLYFRASQCYLVMNDLTNAEGELQKFINRTDSKGKDDALFQLDKLVRDSINVPDTEYLLKKYAEPTGNNATNTDSTGASKIILVRQLVVESFGESAKVNPEADKSYIVIHSQVPWLRFDSNRRIIKIDQISDGEWGLWLTAGTHILKIDAKGFQRLELPPINFVKSRCYDLRIKTAISE